MKRTLRNDNILALGEATGHRHAADGVEEVYEYEDGTREFDATHGSVVITHQEHHAIAMPFKVMRSGIVREYDSFAREARQVVD